MASVNELSDITGQPAASDDVFVFPASFAQQRLWFLDKLEPGQNTYNVPFAVRLTGDLKVSVVEHALRELVLRHEVLRTTLSEDESGRPIQLVAAEPHFALSVSDLRSIPHKPREVEVPRLVMEHRNLAFDLRQGPLFRATLFRLTDTDYVLSLVFHHVIVDGWSWSLVLNEFSLIYEAFLQGKSSPLAPLPIQYGDYSTWQHDWLKGERLDNLLAYWKKQLGDAPPVIELPSDFPRPSVQTSIGAQEAIVVPPILQDALTALSQKGGVTLFMTILTAFNLLLARYSGQEDIVVGTPISGRTRSELEGLIGFFVNTLPLRTDVSGNPTFRELLARVRETSIEAYAHQDLPFERLVEELSPDRDLSRNPIVQVLYLFEDSSEKQKKRIADLTIGAFHGAERTTAKFDMQFSARVNSDGLRLALTYNVDLFRPATVQHMLGHLRKILDAMVANPEGRTGELCLLNEAERQQVLVEFNNTAKPAARNICVHQLVEQQAERTPEAIAVEFQERQLSYRDFNARANQLAHHLISLGVKPDSRVGVCVHRSPEMLIAVLGIMKAGGAYVPIDPAYPRDRVEFMQQDGGAEVLVTDSAVLETISAQNAKIVCFDRDAAVLAKQSLKNPQTEVTPANLSYVIFTSGSTGNPKGVQLEHRNVVNFIGYVQRIFQVGREDVYLGVASMSFDASVLDFYLPLSVGAKLVIVDGDTTRDPNVLAETITRTGITVMHATPSTWRSLVDGGWKGNAKFKLLSGGEALSWDLAAELLPRCSALWNLYGPTETAVYSAVHRVTASDGTVLVGSPIDNTQIYILDSLQHPTPVGVPGEIWIGGAGVARGYLNRPQLTTERFVEDPFVGGGARMYRTGDLGRFRPDGVIQCLGRIDNQVKLRGFRIELGEIESILAKHSAVQNAVVVLREDVPGDKRLVAYIVPRNSNIDAVDLRSYLKQSLPEYMVPSAFVELNALPLTPSGKVSRQSLPVPDWGATSLETTAPRNPIEELLVGIWSEILRRKGFGVNDNFFDLGGHSLLATQLVSRIRRSFNVELPLRLVFEHPVVAELAHEIERARHASGTEIGPRLSRIPRETEKKPDGTEIAVFPVSFAEQRLWMLDRLQPNSAAYNVSFALRLIGELRVDALERSLEEILRRHEILRASFRLRGDEPEQCIAPATAVSIPITDVSRESSPETAARDLVRQESQRPFDLANGPLWRASLAKLANDDYVLLITVHHIVFDGWSGGVLLRELAAHYTAFATGTESQLPELEIQYPDFAVWQREYLSGARLDRQVNYWKQQLAGAPGHIDLPTDRLRPQTHSFKGAHLRLNLPEELTSKLRHLAQKNESTLFMTLLGAFNVLLARYSGQDDVVVGSPIAGRTHAETEKLIGFFVNTIPLRTNVAANPTFKQLLASIRESTLDAYAHQDLPFEKLVEELKPERDLSRNPIFQVMFTLQNVPREAIELTGLQISPFRAGHAANSKFDLSLIAVEDAGTIAATFEYSTDLFEAGRIERMQRHWLTLLEAIVANPDCPVADLPLLEESERQQVLVDWNETGALAPSTLLHQFIQKQAERTPAATALIDGTRRIAYSDLNQRANQLARKLQKLGVGPEILVAVCTERCADMIVALLAVLKAGGAYVPLDPTYPKDRLAKILEDSHAEVMITQEHLTSSLPPHAAELLFIDRDWHAIAAESAENLDVAVAANNLAYVLFTSGSTGRPKGVAIEHRSASIFVQWAQTVFTPEELSGTLFGTSICFDLSVFEMFVPLSVGGAVIIAQNALALRDLPAANEVRLINTVPSAIAELLHLNAVPSSVLTVNLAGEALPETLAREIYEQTSVRRLYNLYGPTEDTTYSTYTLVPRTGEVTIGRPLANTQAYILDSRRHPIPIGVPGELYLAGDGLARGYYGRDDLTSERFVANPFSAHANPRMYRTGDRCRYRTDGTIEYLGRIDNQVKLRGFRIELGEIESILAKHSAVQNAVVVLREDVPGDKRLVAYIVPRNSNIDAVDLRSYLKQSLPEYMVPSAFVELNALPLTPSGKVSRQSLPVPDWGATSLETTAPRNPIEELLVGIWSEILRRKGFGVNDNFFDLGGHSLLATQLVSRIRRSFNVELPLRLVFEHPVVAELAHEIERARHASGTEIGPRLSRIPRETEKKPDGTEIAVFPVSFAEQRLWMLDRLQPNSAAYNVSFALRLIGELRVDALERSLEEILRRHEILRASFRLRGDEPEQCIAPATAVSIPITDVSRESSPETAARDLVRQESQRPFDLANGPLWRASLAKLANDDYVLLITVHHIVFDGWSGGVLLRELAAHYTAFATGTESQLPELEIQYPDFAVWQREYLSGARLDRQVNYWKQQLAGAPGHIDLPTDRLRPQTHSFKGAHLRLNLPEELTSKLRHLAQKNESTLFMTLLGAFNVLLARYSGQDDVVVGSPIAGRTHAETEKLIGFFVNTIPLRTNVAANPTFKQLLASIRESTLDAYAHQDLPFEKLVEELKPERDLSRNPIFQVMFTLQNVPREAIELTGLQISPFRAGHAANSKFDLSLIAVEDAGTIAATFEYSTDLFEAGRIERMQRHWLTLLEAIVANPDCPVADLSLLEESERRQQIVSFNVTEKSFPRELCVHQLFEQQVQRTPDAIAATDGKVSLSYAELDRRANQLARFLQKRGVKPQTLVGVCLERSVDMLVAVLGVLKAGAAYVPIDPAYPKDRIAFVVQDSQAQVLITQSSLLGILPETSAHKIHMDADWASIAKERDKTPETQTNANGPAYVIYTSGSTGKPKGVEILHQNVVNFLASMQREPGFKAEDVLLAVTTLSFDIAGLELHLPLTVGGRIVIASREEAADGAALTQLLNEHEVTVMQATPATWRLLIDSGWHGDSKLKVLCGGEALPRELAERLLPLCGELWNMYGPTETTIWSSVYRVQDLNWTSAPIGRPIANTQMYVLDKALRLAPLGVPGELHIGGEGLARGYWNRPELTSEKFIADPFSKFSGARLYKTGDLVRYLPDGNLQYLSRIDNQVKLRGFRIELGEIESVLAEHEAVEQAVVIVRENSPGNQQLVAYLVTRRAASDLASQLRAFLLQRLPAFMVPSAFVALDAFPLTPNGKVDRRALPLPEAKALAGSSGFVAPHTPTEQALVAIWGEVLHLTTVGIDQDFFALGGHSLLATQVITRIQARLNRDLPLRTLFEHPTVERLAKAVDEVLEKSTVKTRIAPANRAAFRAKRH